MSAAVIRGQPSECLRPEEYTEARVIKVSSSSWAGAHHHAIIGLAALPARKIKVSSAYSKFQVVLGTSIQQRQVGKR